MEFWHHHGYHTIAADSQTGPPFSLAEARNRAVTAADADIVIVADADTIPDIASVEATLANPEGVTWPFKSYVHIPNDWADKSDLAAAPVVQRYSASLGGIFICRRALYWELGGTDERFDRRWGYEDNAFHAVAKTLSTVHRQPGVIYSFDHEVEGPGRDLSGPNKARFALYQFALGKPDVMKELIKR